MAEAPKTEILLESGTNELEVLVFDIAGNSFGINVAKVKNLMQYTEVQPMPKAHPNIEGVFKPRDIVLTVVDLAGYMGLPASEDASRDIMIITSFNQMNLAFHVHKVERIWRISWRDIEKPDPTIYGGTEGIVTGIAHIESNIVSIIDFEKIIFDISPESGIKMSEVESLGERPKNERPIIMAEDSELLRRMILESLTKAGYTNIAAFSNGSDAWDRLAEIRLRPGLLEESVCCLITDIEMPLMDGHHLTKRVKDDQTLRRLPVIIFSSLIDDKMRVKGEEVGADAQLTKPEIGKLIETIDRLIL